MKGISLSSLVLIVWVVSQASSSCPPSEDLEPLCWCKSAFYGGVLTCRNVINPTELVGPVQSTAEMKMFSFTVINSTLLYFPQTLFRLTRFEMIMLKNTHLMSLSDGHRAFQGLENTLQEFRVSEAEYAASWRWSELRYLERLTLLEVQGVSYGALYEPFPSLPSLTALGLIRADISLIADQAFASLKGLSVLDLSHNRISELKRSMFPLPASSLNIVKLGHNELSVFDPGLFEDMPSLQVLNLENNKIFTLEKKSFSILFTNLDELHLKGNNIYCDCRLRWILGHDFPRILHATCNFPSTLKGVGLKSLGYKDLWC